MDNRELKRAIDTLQYYRFSTLPLRFSHFLKLEKEMKYLVFEKMRKSEKLVEVFSYCFMPNHFHLLLKQIITNNNGISKFVSNFTNSYTRYFNTKHKRVGPLFQGLFKAVHIENEEQLLHVSRYIHLNPVSSYLIEASSLHEYA